MKFDFEYCGSLEEVRKNIKQCEGKHIQQIAYSSYHDSLTQICFSCLKIRSNITDFSNSTKSEPRFKSPQGYSTKSEFTERFKEKLEMVLDKQFPKEECKERGQALVLFAQAVILFERCYDVKDTQDTSCLNCGKLKSEHLSGYGKVKYYCSFDSKPYQHYKHSPNGRGEGVDCHLISPPLEDAQDTNSVPQKHNQKGCGKKLCWDDNWVMSVCGVDGQFCPKCQEDAKSVSEEKA